MIALFLTTYAFATVGMAFFGGLIYVGAECLEGTAFAESDYYTNSFNDIGSALVVLFELTVVNNWFIIMDGVVACSSDYARIYFIFWYLISVVLGMNLLVAYVLDAFSVEKKKAELRAAVDPKRSATLASVPAAQDSPPSPIRPGGTSAAGAPSGAERSMSAGDSAVMDSMAAAADAALHRSQPGRPTASRSTVKPAPIASTAAPLLAYRAKRGPATMFDGLLEEGEEVWPPSS